MCRYKTVVTYNCGHQNIDQELQPNAFCLFNPKNNFCARELGSFRVMEETVNDWCPKCFAVASAMMTYKNQFGPQNNFPCATEIEIEKQKRDRYELEQSTFTPGPPKQSRLRHINTIARRLLAELVKRPDYHAPEVIAWIVRYITSLPSWINRSELVSEMIPRFGALLDEDHQITLRPNLRSIGCEHTLDDVMVWRWEG